MKKIMIIALFAGMLLACRENRPGTRHADPLEEARNAIAASNALYFESYVKNDSSIFINRYAEDACILAPNAPEMCGREAVARFFRDSYRDYGMRNGKFITTAVYGDGRAYVTEEGRWQSFDAPKATCSMMVNSSCFGKRLPTDGRCIGTLSVVIVNTSSI